jgi:Ca-activated chloride channel family protein
VSINVSISSKAPIKNVYSPTHEVRVERFTDHRANVTYTERDTKPAIDYRLYYSTAEKDLGASLICYRPDPGKPGYFLLLVSPRTEIDESKILPKNLICVIDRSGSMSGEKIEQARSALKFVLNSLNKDDRFALISYNDTVDVMTHELLAYSKASRDRALGYVDALKANGGTNIRDALVEALKLAGDGDRPNIVIFLTDGLPTVGETNIERIAEAVGKANEVNARLFTFGVGFDVNAVLLDKLSSGNHGVSEYVRPDEDIEVKVSSFYAKVQSPMLTDITVDYGNELVSDVYPRELPDLFKGGQLVLAGRYGGSAKATLIIKGKLQGAERAFEYPLEYKAETDRLANNFVARLWATKRIGYLLDEMRLHGRNQELIDEVVRLSKEFGVITEYTSFLVTEDVEPTSTDAVRRANLEMGERFKADTGAHGVGQAQNARRMQDVDQVNVQNEYYDEKGGIVRYNRVRNIGDRAFYSRQGFWVDATYDEETQKPIEVRQFSKEFFELSRKLGRDNQYLSFASNIIVNIEGQAYKIVPAESPDDQE